MSFCKPCHMPLHKFIPPFKLTVHGFNQSRIEKASKDFSGVTDTFGGCRKQRRKKTSRYEVLLSYFEIIADMSVA